MATTGLLEPLPLSGAGPRAVLITGELWDLLATRVNMLCSPSVNPPSNVGAFYVSKAGVILDLSLLDQRLSNVVTRLDNASASANCIGNSVNIAFNI